MEGNEEYLAYQMDVDRLTSLYAGGAVLKTLLKEIMASFGRFAHPEYKAHFLYMLTNVLMDMGEKETAYRYSLEIERLFPDTHYTRAAGDMNKSLFVDEGGTLRPIPTFTPTVQIEPTNYCNLDCIMCGRNRDRPLGHMDFGVFKKVVDQSLEAGAYGIRLYHMGEPLLHPSLALFIEYFRYRVEERGFRDPCIPRRIGIMTNGTLLNEALVKGLMESCIGGIGFSIDGRTPEEFEKIRRGARFSRVMENLKMTRRVRDLHRFPTEVSVSITDMALDVAEKARLHDFYMKSGADIVSFLPCAMFEGRHTVNRDGHIVPNGEIKKEIPHNQPLFARNELDRIVVLWNGDIKSSCGEPSNGDIIGSIQEISLIEAYGIKMRRLGLMAS